MEKRICLYSSSAESVSLAGRKNAEELIDAYMPTLKHLRDGDKVVVDFEKIVACTASYLDGIFYALRQRLTPGVVVFVENIENEELFEEFEALAGYYKVVRGGEFSVVYQDGKKLDIVGTVDKAGRRAFQLLTERNLTSRQLSEIEGKAQNAAANQLNRLYKAGLIFRRQIVDSDGRSYIYYLR